jgi:hypothetical protein
MEVLKQSSPTAVRAAPIPMPYVTVPSASTSAAVLDDAPPVGVGGAVIFSLSAMSLRLDKSEVRCARRGSADAQIAGNLMSRGKGVKPRPECKNN